MRSVRLDWLLWHRRVDPRPRKLQWDIEPGQRDDSESIVQFLARRKLSNERSLRDFEEQEVARYKDWRLDDIRARITQEVGSLVRLDEIVRDIVEQDFRATPVFIKGEPKMPVGDGVFTRWLEMSARLDPDVVTTLFYALNYPESVPDYEKWPLVVRPHDLELREQFQLGTSDLHIHLGSIINIAYLWQQVVTDNADFPAINLDQLTLYSHGEELSDEVEQERLFIERAIAQAKDAGLWLLRDRYPQLNLTEDRLDKDLLPLVVGRSPSAVLTRERGMLVDAWKQIIAKTSRGEALLAPLEDYIVAKCLFRSRYVSSFRENPGLAFFRQRRMRYLPSRLLSREHRAFMSSSMAVLNDTRSLRRAEVRLDGSDEREIYRNMLRVFARARQGSTENLDVRLGFSFKRFSDLGDSNKLHERLGMLARKTAMLHQVRYDLSQLPVDDSDRSLLELISRVDIASEERDAPIWLVAFYIRLLRGQASAYEALQESDDHDWVAWWKALLETNQIHFSHDSLDLGVTCHAGEDFYSLVDGLWSIDMAIQGLGLQGGDGIGHGLALGLKPELHDIRNRVIPRGVQLDSLAWLHEYLLRHFPDHAELLPELQRVISDESEQVYGRVVSAGVLHSKTTQFDVPLHVNSGGINDSALALRYEDLTKESVRKKRAERIQFAPFQFRILSFLKDLQKHMLTSISKAGIVVETNPSSNLGTTGLRRASELPIFDMLNDHADDFVVTMCTDNPGLYDISVESEYALLSEAMESLPEQFSSRRVRHEVLGRIRNAGQHRVNWPAS